MDINIQNNSRENIIQKVQKLSKSKYNYNKMQEILSEHRTLYNKTKETTRKRDNTSFDSVDDSYLQKLKKPAVAIDAYGGKKKRTKKRKNGKKRITKKRRHTIKNKIK